MGIKIRNDTQHDVIVLVFTYVPTLFYRKTLVIPSGERVNCPTWQSAVKIYAWEADENAQAIAEKLRSKLAWVNTGRLVLAPVGGEVLGALADTLDVFVDSIIEWAIEHALEKLEDKLDKADEDLDRITQERIREAQANSMVTFKTSVTKKTFLITQNQLFLRRQLSVHRNTVGQLEINGAGMSWF